MSGLLELVGFVTVGVFVFKMARPVVTLGPRRPSTAEVVYGEDGWPPRPDVSGRVVWTGPQPGPPVGRPFATAGDIWWCPTTTQSGSAEVSG